MHWIAPSEKDPDNAGLEKRLLDAGSNCEVRSANCDVPSVRQSKFDIRTSRIPASLDYDAFGRIYEYFLGEFAMSEGQGGGDLQQLA